METDERTRVLDRLSEYARTVLPMEAVDQNTPLVSSGLLKSLETARLIAFVQEEFAVWLPPTELNRHNFETLGRIADLVTSLRSPDGITRA